MEFFLFKSKSNTLKNSFAITSYVNKLQVIELTDIIFSEAD